MTFTQPWTHQYRPKKKKELVGNREAVGKLEKWIKSWKNKPPKKRAAFVYGPPGTGKTVAIQTLASENGYDLMEINASDSRTKNRIEEVLGKAAGQTVTVFGRPRMILLDEMEGVSGQKDRGGISAISNLIKTTRVPMVLVATTIEENMEAKFRPLRGKATLIEFQPVSFSEVYKSLEKIAQDKGVKVHSEVLDNLSYKSQGDLRSAINDLETVSRGKTEVNLDDITWMGTRDRQYYTPNIINRIFTARSLWEARQTISQSMIAYEDLFDWIYENLPLVIDEPSERLHALETLAKADIYQKRARFSNYRLLKYMFNLMTGGVAFTRTKSQGHGLMRQVYATIQRNGFPLSSFQTTETKNGIMIKPNKWLGRDLWGKINSDLRGMGASWRYGQNFWVLPYFREPQNKWRYITTYHHRRRMKAVAAKLAVKTHTSTQEALTEILPLLKIIYNSDQENAERIDKWLDLEDKEQEYLYN